MRKGIIGALLVVCIVVGFLAGWFSRELIMPGAPIAEKEKITIGFTVSLTGAYASSALATTLPVYQLWAEQVNKRGGLYIKELGKRLPVSLIYYDDRSDTETCVRLYEKLIVEDNVDFLLPPWGTALHYAILPIAEKYEYPIIANTMAASPSKFAELKPKWFWICYWSVDAAYAPFEFLKKRYQEGSITKLAVLYQQELHTVEMATAFLDLCKEANIPVVLSKDYPKDVKDISSVLLEAKQKGADALFAGSYPGDTVLIVTQCIEVGWQPKFMYFSIGPFAPAFVDKFGGKPEAEGVSGILMFNAKGPGAQEFVNAFESFAKRSIDLADDPKIYASCQVLEQAIELAGSLDRAKVREALLNNDVTTIFGVDRYFENCTHKLAQAFCGMGQWVQGSMKLTFNPFAPDWVTAEPVFPKPW